MIVFEGNLERDGRWWAVQIPSLAIYTQGRTRKEAYFMVEDALRELLDRPKMSVKVIPLPHNRFHLIVDDEAKIIPYLLKNQRAHHNLTLKTMAKALGCRSVNNYAQYEQGKCQPTLGKMQQFLAAMNSRLAICLSVVDVGAAR